MRRLIPLHLVALIAAFATVIPTHAAHAAVPRDAEISPSATPTAAVASDSPEPPLTAPSLRPTPLPTSIAPIRPVDMRVLAIGDSVMLGAKGCLEKLGYVVDAEGSRRPSAVALELGLRRTKLPRRIVIHTGTNGGATVADLDRIVHSIGLGHQIVFVTVQLPDHSKYSFEARTNAAIASVAARVPYVRVADWHTWSDDHEGLTYADGIHLPPAGCRAFAWVVASTLRFSFADSLRSFVLR